MFGLSGFGIKLIIAGIALAAIIGAIIMWRNDIKTAAYDAIFKEQVENNLAEQKKAMKRLEESNAEKEKSLAQALAKAKELEKKITDLDQAFKAQNFKNAPLDPGVQFTLDQIRQMEQQRTP